jgi:hypothetical protein
MPMIPSSSSPTFRILRRRGRSIPPPSTACRTGRRWREITQDRGVPIEWAGREPIFPWEAKVYALA